MDHTSLSARRLVQVFGTGDLETRVLRDISVNLTPGQMTLAMGPSGCGKTTLLSVLSGLLPPTSGTVMAGDRDIYALSTAERREFRRRHVGFIFQRFHLFPTLTPREQVEMVLRWGEDLSAKEAARRTQDMFELLNLTHKADMLPLQLSGGEQQRVAIARALIKEPTLVFADEPTSALDGDRGKQVMEILTRAAHDRHCTVLVVTHDPRVTSFADRILYMEDGTVTERESGTQSGRPPERVIPTPNSDFHTPNSQELMHS
jgi:putative ABC transport system ATP-binding protein